MSMLWDGDDTYLCGASFSAWTRLYLDRACACIFKTLMHAHILINNDAHSTTTVSLCVVANFQEVLSRNMMGRIITTIQAHPFLWVIATSACRKSPPYTSLSRWLHCISLSHNFSVYVRSVYIAHRALWMSLMISVFTINLAEPVMAIKKNQLGMGM